MAKPRYKFGSSLNAVSAGVIEHDSQGGGEPQLSISLRRRFFDRKANQWKTSVCYLTPETLSAAIAVLKTVESELLEIRSNDSQDRQPQDEASDVPAEQAQ